MDDVGKSFPNQTSPLGCPATNQIDPLSPINGIRHDNPISLFSLYKTISLANTFLHLWNHNIPVLHRFIYVRPPRDSFQNR
jgi:hypothetical protein